MQQHSTSPSTALLFVKTVLLLQLLHVQAVPLSAWTEGTASFFGGPKNDHSNDYQLTIDSGSCGYGDFDPRLYPFYNVVGLHKSNPLVKNRPMDACGSCLELVCDGEQGVSINDRPIQAVITDQCVTDCNSTNINIHVFGFEQLAPLRFGRMHIRYRLVECEPADPITVHIQDYRPTEGGWIRLALKNVAGDAALTAVDIGVATADVDTQDWVPCKNTFGAVWEAGLHGDALPEPPLSLRITNSLKQQVIIKNAVAYPGMIGDVETTAQFPSPYEDSTSEDTVDADNATTAAQSNFVPPVAKSLPSVTIGMAIPKPTNTLAGPTPGLIANTTTTNLTAGAPQIANTTTNLTAGAPQPTPVVVTTQPVQPSKAATTPAAPTAPATARVARRPVPAAVHTAITMPRPQLAARQPIVQETTQPQRAVVSQGPAAFTTTAALPGPSSPHQIVASDSVVAGGAPPAAMHVSPSAAVVPGKPAQQQPAAQKSLESTLGHRLMKFMLA